MPRSRQSPCQQRLQQLLIEARLAAGLTQTELARTLQRPQSFVSKYESGERRLDVVEFLQIAEIIELNVQELIQEILKISG
jgi:transcriptional regulator with XRE-family HTH domain